MPYKFETKKTRLPKEFDRRRKLTDKDKVEILKLYKDGLFVREIARRFEHKVCRRTIQFILFPEKRLKMMKNRDWRDYYDKEVWTKTMREHRRYKQKILTEIK